MRPARTTSEPFGVRLRRLREARGLSQRDIAGPGVSHAHISRLETGERAPSMKALRVLARNLAVSVEYLETGSELRADEALDLRLSNAELELRFSDTPAPLAKVFRKLHAEAVAAGDKQAAVRCRIGLGLAEAAAGRHTEAALQLERAIRDPAVSPATHPEVHITLARSLSACGAHDDAIASLRACVATLRAQRPLNVAAYVRFATALSYALHDDGQASEAAAVLRDATARAAQLSPDPYSQVRLYWGQARVLATEDPAAALRFMRQAVSLLETTEDTLQLARANLMCAAILLSEDDVDQAAVALTAAEPAILVSGEAQDKAWLRAEQGKLSARTGHPQAAVAHAREALALLATDDPAERGRALWALAEGLAGQGDIDGAEAAFADAAQLLALEHREQPVLRAWEAARAKASRIAP